MTVLTMARWKREVYSTLNKFNKTAWKQFTALEELWNMFSKFMSLTKDLKDDRPSASKAAVEKKNSFAKLALQKHAQR